MKRLYLSFFSFLYIAVVLSSLLVFVHPPKVSATTPFNANNLIDDFTFENTGSMTASTIDAWLNANFPSSCISSNNSFTSPDPQGWSDAQGKYLFGASATAGKAIADASVLYHLSPQVILATLQKEQSIVSGGAGCHPNNPDPNWPSSPSPAPNSTFTCTIGGKSTTCTYACPDAFGGGCMNIAMSYGCPGYCSAKDESFGLQLTLGSWILRFSEERAYGILTGYQGYETGDENFTYSGPMTAGYRQRVAGGQSVYYDGTYTTSDGTSVTIANGPTASLYTYTPFISGNQKFDNIFQGALSDGYLGFGSVYANDTFTPHPNGTLISSGGRVYLIDSGTRRWITNGEVFNSYGYGWNLVKAGSTGDANLPVGTNIDTLAPGTIFRSDNTPVYVMTYEGGTLVKQQISYSAFNSLGYSWSEVAYIPPGEVPSASSSSILFNNQHPAGTLLTDSTVGKVYLLDQTSKRWILGPNAFATNNFNWGAVKKGTSLDLSLPDGSPVDLRQGSMLYSGGNIYLTSYDGSGIFKQPVGPWECFSNRLHYTLSDTYNIPTASLPTRTGSVFSC